MWNLLKLNEFCEDKNKVLEFLKERGLLKKSMKCPKCGWDMRVTKENFVCYKQIKSKKGKKICYTKVSVRRGTWFDNCRLGLGEILKLTYMLTYNYKQLDIVRELNISKVTVSQWNIYLKQVMIEWLSSTSEILGGPGEVVEVDESKFGKPKYHKGHFVEGQWVFGGIQRGSSKIFLVPIENTNSETLVKIIKYWVKPGTTIISDSWKGYKNLTEEGYKHLTVDHSVTFKNEISGAHTNTIESMWRHIKSFLPTYHRQKDNFIGYLAHFSFLKHTKTLKKDPFDLILEEISKLTSGEHVGMNEFEIEEQSDSASKRPRLN